MTMEQQKTMRLPLLSRHNSASFTGMIASHLLFLTCIMLLGGIQGTVAWAAEPAAAEETKNLPEQTVNHEKLLLEIFGPTESFVYQKEGRPDPFLPFLQEKVLQQEIRTDDHPMEELTGLRQFEPNQLQLVAIIFGGDAPVAMVQDPVGKGYPVRIGTMIGRYGIIEQIVPNAVIVKQTARTWDQEKLYKRVEMVLRKEGEL